MGEITIIRNPHSGRRRGLARWKQYESMLPHAKVLLTEARGHAIELARNYATEGGIVAAAGGDGTLHEVLQGVHGTGATLALLPLGTGNDFARTVGITPENACDTLTNGSKRIVDVAEWQSNQGSGLFLNVAGCGFDAAVADRINQGIRRLSGTSAYLAAVLQTLWTYRSHPMKVTVDGQQIEASVMLCAVANATCYGGGMRIAPSASCFDGQLDVVLVKEMGKAAFLRSFPRVFAGTHVDHPSVSVVRGREVQIECLLQAPLLADGEIVSTTPAKFRLASTGIPMMLPVDCQK